VRDHYDVIVVGEGPAGATVSGLLSKWGRRVLLLEKEKFPPRGQDHGSALRGSRLAR
jgi:flavin-dependent dehydrogenase